MQQSKRLPDALSQQFTEFMLADMPPMRAPDWLVNPPAEPQPLDRSDRIAGLAMLWSTARTSFAYWAAVPDLDWDAAFRSYIPLVAEAEEPAVYYRLLSRFVALLRENHSYVVPPVWVTRLQRSRPRLGLYPVDGRPVVTRGDLPAGTAITHVDGVPILDRVAEELPYVTACTDATRYAIACGRVLEGPHESVVRLGVELADGRPDTVELPRLGGLPAPPLVEREDLGGGRVLVRLNGFGDHRVVDMFHEAFPDFDGITALVLDLRRNGGGNTLYGDAILARLITERAPSRCLAYRPLYWGAMATYGVPQPWVTELPSNLEPDTNRPQYTGPVAVLTSVHTCSAAEDFCATFRGTGRGPLVGDTTAGSTGDPAAFPLPGGGIGAISATYCEYQGQEPFAGVGIRPDGAVSPTRAGLVAGRDEVLERALVQLER